MADKEAAVFVVDLGASMARTASGRSQSNLDWAMRFVWSKLGDMAASGRKTLCAGLVAFRTRDTANSMGTEEGYSHISVLSGLGPVSLDALRQLQTLTVVNTDKSSSMGGDAVSAVVVAVDMIEQFTKKQKWIRKVYLITDAEAPIDADDVEAIAGKMNGSGIQLNVLGVDFDDAEYGFKEEAKSQIKTTNEQHLRALVDQIKDGQFATIAEAIDALDVPRVKQVRPYKSYDGFLTLGGTDGTTPAISIQVERYFKTHRATPASATTVTVRGDGEEGSTAQISADDMDGVEFAAVKQSRTYKVDDPSAPGGKRDVDFEALAKGYEYGRTAVHISESEYNITKLETGRSFELIGFVHKAKYEPFLTMGDAGIVIPRKNDAEAQLALSSLVWSLEELESYAVARIVPRDGRPPLLVLLAPCIEPGLDCLYDVPLPFAEDVRPYRFPPLDRIVTVSGASVTKNHSLLPSDALVEAMDDFVDAMDLTEAARDDDGNPAEFAQMEDTFNPMIHRLNHAILNRALYPEQPIPEIPPVLLQYTAPPDDLLASAQKEIEALVEAADVKKVPPKSKGRRNREIAKPISGLDIESLLLGPSASSYSSSFSSAIHTPTTSEFSASQPAPGDSEGTTTTTVTSTTTSFPTVSQENSIPDFKRALVVARSIAAIHDAARQMATIIRALVTDSFSNSLYSRAQENLAALREELAALEEPGVYNDFVRRLKKDLLAGELGGDRRDFWILMKRAKMGLLDDAAVEGAGVSAEEAEMFYKVR